ncbi:hypothetical protein [Dactylosporangium sp. NPDC005555]
MFTIDNVPDVANPAILPFGQDLPCPASQTCLSFKEIVDIHFDVQEG